MSKVPVDRELLERCVDRWACCAIVETPGAEQAWLELRAAVRGAQPAEAEVAVTKIECTTCRETGSLEFEGGAVVKDCAPCKGTGRDLKAERYALAARLAEALAALSAVTAERDRLRPIHAMILNALDRDAEEGKTARGEMAAELRAALAAKEAWR